MVGNQKNNYRNHGKQTKDLTINLRLLLSHTLREKTIGGLQSKTKSIIKCLLSPIVSELGKSFCQTHSVATITNLF